MTKRSLFQKYKAVLILEKSINVIYHINRMKDKNIWSLSDSEKALTKSNTHSWFVFLQIPQEIRKRREFLWRTSLMVQWLRIHLLMQGTWVQSLVQEDSICQRAIKPMYHYWAPVLKPTSHGGMPRARAPQQEKPTKWETPTSQPESSPHSPQLEQSPRTALKTQNSQK